MQRNGGLLSKDDFASYRAVERPPIRFDYRGFQIVVFPAEQRGIHVAQILGMLENTSFLNWMNPIAIIRVLGEAMKTGLCHRAIGLETRFYQTYRLNSLTKPISVKPHGLIYRG